MKEFKLYSMSANSVKVFTMILALAILLPVGISGNGKFFSLGSILSGDPNDCCDDDNKPKVITMLYTGEGCNVTEHSQDPQKVSCSGDPSGAVSVYIIASEKEDGDGKIWFEANVNLNDTYDIDAAKAGEDKLKSTTWVQIYDSQGGDLLQKVKFHTSCSQPLFIGNQFGASKVMEIAFEQGGLCSTDDDDNDNDDDDDDDNDDDCCFLGVETDNTLTGDGNLGSELSVNLSTDPNNQLTLGTDGALHVAPDADTDPLNELQTLSRTGNDVYLSDGGGMVNIEDDDSDSANELQSLFINGHDLTISNGNTVTMPDNVDDADNDPTNELQNWSNLPGIPADFSDGVDNVDDADNDPNNEKDADWYKVGTSLPPQNISDNIFTTGTVGIGLNSPTATLHLLTNNASDLLKVDGVQTNSLFVNKEGYVGIGTNNIPTYGNNILTVGFASVFKGDMFCKQGFIYTEGGTGISKGALGYRSSDNSYFLSSLGSEKIAFAIGTNELPVADMRAIPNEGKTFRVTTEVSTANLPGHKDIANIELESSYYNGSSNRALSRLRNEVSNTNSGDYQLDVEVGGDKQMSILSNGNVGIGTTAPSEKLHVAGNVFANGGIFITSDKRFKKEIKPLEGVLEKIQKLNGVSYQFKTEEFKERGFTERNQLGIIAQNLEKVYPELVKDYEDGYKAVNYDGLIPVLIEGLKEQQRVIKQLEVNNDGLSDQVGQLSTENAVLQTRLNELEDKLDKVLELYKTQQERIGYQKVHLDNRQQIVLNQNDPNPFKERTKISYFLPEDSEGAELFILDSNGSILKRVRLTIGAGIVEVFASNLSPGLYSYSIVVNGKVVDTKKMVASK